MDEVIEKTAAVDVAPEHEFYVVRAALGKEDKFLDSVWKMLEKKENHGIYAIFRPETVKGYVFAEAENLTKLVDSLRGIPNFKGAIKEPIQFDEISKYFDKASEQIHVNERDMVEVIAGPFKGDRARVVRIVPGKDEVVVEPTNMPVPIPVTLSLDDIRVIEDSNVSSESDKEDDEYGY
ncbi:MAG: transcription elongation factor Spt5 [Nanoarchaeales archaeon]|nr:transcription elongation factor Spt5 [Nanoarchaeales archaeon]